MGDKLDRDKIRRFWDGRARHYQDMAFESIANLEQDGDNLKLKITHETDKVFGWLGSVAGKSVLDLGAGVGQWAFRFAERGASRVMAVEYSAELAAIGETERERRGLDNVRFVVSPIESFATSEQFDVVFCSGLCVYLDDEQFAVLARNLPGWVRPGGVVLVRDGMGRTGRHEINDRFSEHLQSNYSATYRTREMYIDQLAGSALTLVQDENMFPEGHPLNKYPETRLHLFQFERKS